MQFFSKFVKFLPILVLSLMAGTTLAFVFPNDSVNVRNDLTGDSSWTAFTPASGSVYTVLYESFNTSSTDVNGNLTVQCDGVKTLQVNSFKNVPQIERWKMAKCKNSLIATTSNTTGSPTTTLSLIYVPYDLASNSFDYTPYPLGLNTASSSFKAYATFTAGELMIILALFILVMLQLFNIFRRHI